VTLTFDELRTGDLLAEGGEGQVFQLPLQPQLVYKRYRRPVPREQLESLVSWPSELGLLDPDAAARVTATSAWPCSVVTGGSGEAIGLLMPRAPRRFALRHRDGNTRLASLSYLTSDPAQRAAAYGLLLPPPASAPRLGLVLALARLLAAFEAGEPVVGHGDLSTKNVLWSLQRGPEVFVIDCDNSERFTPGGDSLGPPGRRRAMTPNWDDPAVPRGGNPTRMSDRYSLALIFLRIFGAANFPMQARQRSGDMVSVDFPVPPGPLAGIRLDEANPLWELCARGLSVACPDSRPPAADWVPVIEAVLARGRPRAASRPDSLPGDVQIRPVSAPRRRDQRWNRAPRVAPLRPHVEPAAPSGLSTGPVAPLHATPVTSVRGPSIWPDVWAGLRRAVAWWLAVHARMLSGLSTRGRRAEGIRTAVFCGLLDLVLAIITLFVAAMIVSPVIGI